jgi:hypothetical protein
MKNFLKQLGGFAIITVLSIAVVAVLVQGIDFLVENCAEENEHRPGADYFMLTTQDGQKFKLESYKVTSRGWMRGEKHDGGLVVCSGPFVVEEVTKAETGE